MATNKINRVITGLLISLTLFVSRATSQAGGEGILNSNETVFGILADWLTPINYLQDLTLSSRTVAEISAVLFITSSIYLLLEKIIERISDSDAGRFSTGSESWFEDKLTNGLWDGRIGKRVNLLMFFSILLTLIMGPYLGPWVNTIIGTMAVVGAAGNIIFVIGVGVAIAVGFGYFTGGAGIALQSSGDAAAAGASAFWNSDPVQAANDAKNEVRGRFNDLIQTSTTIDNFAASTAQLINSEVDTRNYDYCENMHQNPKGNRGGSCSVCGDSIP